MKKVHNMLILSHFIKNKKIHYLHCRDYSTLCRINLAHLKKNFMPDVHLPGWRLPVKINNLLLLRCFKRNKKKVQKIKQTLTFLLFF